MNCERDRVLCTYFLINNDEFIKLIGKIFTCNQLFEVIGEGELSRQVVRNS